MRSVRRLGTGFVFALVLAGGVLVARPADAGTLPPQACTYLAGVIERLRSLAPNNPIRNFLLERAEAAYSSACE